MMRTAMGDLMDKNRLGSASTGVGGSLEGSIIRNEDDSSGIDTNNMGNGRRRQRNPQSEIELAD